MRYSELNELKYTPCNKLCKAKKHLCPFQNTWKPKISGAPTDWCLPLFFTGLPLRSPGALLDQDQYLEVNPSLIFKRQMNCLRCRQPWLWFSAGASSSRWTTSAPSKALCPNAWRAQGCAKPVLWSPWGPQLNRHQIWGEKAGFLLCNFLLEASSWCLKARRWWEIHKVFKQLPGEGDSKYRSMSLTPLLCQKKKTPKNPTKNCTKKAKVMEKISMFFAKAGAGVRRGPSTEAPVRQPALGPGGCSHGGGGG